MHSSSSTQNPTLTYNNSNIECLSSCKYLSMHIDPKRDLKSHIQYLEIKIAKSVGILRKLRIFLPKSTLLLCHAFIHPHLIFALPVWGSTFPTYLSKLQRLQNKAIRIIANCNQFQSVTPYFHELEILKMSELFQFEIGKIMHKHFN